MVLDSCEPGGSGMVRLQVAGRLLEARLEFWETLGHEAARLRAGAELEEGELQDLERAAKATEAEAGGLRLLARAEQPRALLETKLLERGFPARAIALACDRLEREGILSDLRYAEAWLRARVGQVQRSAKGSRRLRPEGPSSLLVALRSRGLDEGVSRIALASVLDEDTRRALMAASAAIIGENVGAEGGRGRDTRRAELRGLGWRGDEIDGLEEGG